jgi:ClpP class serine protease
MEGLKPIVMRSGPHKGMGIDAVTDEQIAAQQEIVDGLAAKFTDAVSLGRNMPLAIVEELATGKTWLAEKAQALGLVDEINQSISVTQKDTKMADDTPITPKAETETPVVETVEELKAEDVASGDGENVDTPDPVALERGRIVAILAAFQHDAAFANSAIADGLTVEQAKAAHYDILLAFKAAAPVAEGVDPVTFAAEADSASPQTWLEAVAHVAKRDGIKPAAAGVKASREFPELFANRNN